MSTLTATADPQRSLVRLDMDFSDLAYPPDGVSILRTRLDTAAQALVRPVSPALPVTAVYQQLNVNADFESSVSSWTPFVAAGGALPTLAQTTVAGSFNRGAAAAKLTTNAAGNANGSGIESEKCPVVPGQVYAVSAWIAPVAGTFGGGSFYVPWVGINWYDINGNLLRTTLPGEQLNVPGTGAGITYQPSNNQPAAYAGYGWIAPQNADTATIVIGFDRHTNVGNSAAWNLDECRLLQLVGVVSSTAAPALTLPAALTRSLSGLASAFDHEPPLDTQVSYQAQGYLLNGGWAIQWPTVTSGAPVVSDAFGRTTANGWGNPDLWPPAPNGNGWLNVDGAPAADHLTTPGFGQHTHNAVNLNHNTALLYANLSDVDLQVDTSWSAGTATGAAAWHMIDVRYEELTTYWRIILARTTANTITIELHRANGTNDVTVVGPVTVGALTDANTVSVRAVLRGNQLRATAWLQGAARPLDWLVAYTDTSPNSSSIPGASQNLSGGLRMGSLLTAGATNATPVTFSFANLSVAVPNPTSAGGPTAQTTLPSNGYIWIKDPLAPANSLPVTTSRRIYAGWGFNQSPTGIGFISLPDELRKAYSGVLEVNNRPDPMYQIRQRGTPTGTMTLVTHSFADRDALHTLIQPGTPLLVQCPAGLGIPDRYSIIHDENAKTIGQDHRKQPRLVTLPFTVVSAPAGPAQAPQGYRWQDIGRRAASWAVLQTLGPPQGTYDAPARVTNPGSLGSPDVGPGAWDVSASAVPADWFATNGWSYCALSTVSSLRAATVVSSYGDLPCLQASFLLPGVITGAAVSITVGMLFRYQDINNHYRYVVQYSSTAGSTGNAQTIWQRVIGGVVTNLASSSVYTYAGNELLRMEARLTGSALVGYTWLPNAAARSATPDTALTTDGAPGVLVNPGRVGLIVATGAITNSLPFNIRFRDFLLTTGPTWANIAKGVLA